MLGIWFDNVHSFEDLNLIRTKVDIPPATAKTNFVDIPGGNGSIDLSEALGEVKYKDRECTFTFTVLPSDDFEEKKLEVSNLLNGKRCNITDDKDPDYYWVGRCAVNAYASNKRINQITIRATVSPYKLKKTATKVTVQPGTAVEVVLWNSRMTIVPTIVNTADATIVYKGGTYNINAGTHKILNIELVQGGNPLTVTSTGTVEFTYREGAL